MTNRPKGHARHRIVTAAPIEKMLKEKGWTWYKLMKVSGVSNTTLTRLRHNRAKEMTFDVEVALCLALKCEPGQLRQLVKIR